MLVEKRSKTKYDPGRGQILYEPCSINIGPSWVMIIIMLQAVYGNGIFTHKKSTHNNACSAIEEK